LKIHVLLFTLESIAKTIAYLHIACNTFKNKYWYCNCHYFWDRLLNISLLWESFVNTLNSMCFSLLTVLSASEHNFYDSVT